jgi:diacylglycerol O-acyltransferase / wax synthase
MARHRMDSGDAAWLHMDRPTNLMVVNSIMWFDEPLDWAKVRAVLQERMIARFPRFTQRVVEEGTSVWWEDAEDFDIEEHLHHVTLPAPGGRAELEHYVSWTLHKRLPKDRPMWEFYFVDGYNGGGSALVTRIHHCIADGIALMRVLMSLTDDPHEAALAGVADAVGDDHRGGPLPALVNLAGSMVGDVVHPSRILTLAGTLASGGRALAKVLALPPDAHTALTGHTGRSKRVVWTDPIDLDEVKVAAHAADVTVNDLLLTAVSGALRAYLAREDGHAPDIRAIVPYNIRPLDQPLPAELGNKFGLVFLTLPVSVDDPRERLAELRRRMGAIKNSAEGVVTFEVLDLVGHTPYVVEQVIVDIFASKGTAVMTNVPGPRRPVYLAGRKLGGTIGWPPESGNIAMGVSIISYDGSVIVGLMTDTRLVRDPQSILDQVKVELDELMRWCTLSIVGT